MERIIELAKILGQTLKEQQAFVDLEKAQNEYQSDEKVAQALREYEIQQMALSYEYQKEEKNEEVINAINTRLEELYEQITKSEAFKKYEAAQRRANELLQLVDRTIMAEINGEEDDECGGCSHDCSTCGGCH